MAEPSHEQIGTPHDEELTPDYQDLLIQRELAQTHPNFEVDSGSDYYRGMGHTNEKYAKIGRRPDSDASLFAQEVSRRAETAPDHLIEGADVETELEARRAISVMVARSINYLVLPPEDADPGPRQLLDTRGLTSEQVMAITRETEAILGAMPGESGVETVIPGVTLHYARPDQNDPDRIQIALWRLHPKVRTNEDSYLYSLPANWAHPEEDWHDEAEALPPLPEPAPSTRSVEYTASDLYSDLSATVHKLGRGGDAGLKLARRLSSRASASTDPTDFLSRKDGSAARMAVNDGVLKAAALIDPIGETAPREWDDIYKADSLDETSGTVARELMAIFGAHSGRSGIRDSDSGRIETTVWQTEFAGYSLVFEKLSRNEGSKETPVRVVLAKVGGK